MRESGKKEDWRERKRSGKMRKTAREREGGREGWGRREGGRMERGSERGGGDGGWMERDLQRGKNKLKGWENERERSWQKERYKKQR